MLKRKGTLGDLLRVAVKQGKPLNQLEPTDPQTLADILYEIADRPPAMTGMDVADTIPIDELEEIMTNILGALNKKKSQPK